MKTIKEHLETLPEPYRSQALKNTKESDLIETAPDLTVAIGRAFVWARSPEGTDYWAELRKKVRNGLIELVGHTQPAIHVISNTPVEPKEAAQRDPWTLDELKTLRAMYPDTQNETIALEIGRSESAVAHKAHRLKLRKSEAFNLSTQSGRFKIKPAKKGNIFSRFTHWFFNR